MQNRVGDRDDEEPVQCDNVPCPPSLIRINDEHSEPGLSSKEMKPSSREFQQVKLRRTSLAAKHWLNAFPAVKYNDSLQVRPAEQQEVIIIDLNHKLKCGLSITDGRRESSSGTALTKTKYSNLLEFERCFEKVTRMNSRSNSSTEIKDNVVIDLKTGLEHEACPVLQNRGVEGSSAPSVWATALEEGRTRAREEKEKARRGVDGWGRQRRRQSAFMKFTDRVLRRLSTIVFNKSIARFDFNVFKF